MMRIPKLVQARTPSVLFSEVTHELSNGNGDLLQPLFVSNQSSLCQWMVKGVPSMYEYYLVEAETPAALEASALHLSADGWDFLFNTVLFDGNYLQWMFRLKVVAHVQSFHSLEESVPAGLTMVMDVRPIQILEKGSSFHFLPRVER